jgi:stage II sporulation protein D
MSTNTSGFDGEPIIEVGLVEGAESVDLRFEGSYTDASGHELAPGNYHIGCAQGGLRCAARGSKAEPPVLEFSPNDPNRCHFSLEATIGIDFHWQQSEIQSFRGQVRIIAQADDRLAVINRVPLETYVRSVICSEMNADSWPESAKAHAIISRSWLLAQLDAGAEQSADAEARLSTQDEIRHWTDRQAHSDFHVCADDHCQRYQGITRVMGGTVAQAIAATRGMVLTHAGRACDARFSKCCGGVSENFTAAWGDRPVPYLVPVFDGPQKTLPEPPLTDEAALRDFIERPPEVYCNCTDPKLLTRVLNDYDQKTQDFFRWQVRLEAEQARELIRTRMGIDLGRILALFPQERGLSGRLTKLLIRGEKGELRVGKELTIRKALSDSHLFSSAFVVNPQGPSARPDAFVLKGAGWGHGVGLCQIGAALMASQGLDHKEILSHYYPGTDLERLYD